MKYLTKIQKHNFYNDGFLIIDNFVSENEMNEMRKRIESIINKTSLQEIKGIFTTESNEINSKNNDYFLKSSDKIRIFLEEKAISGGKLNRDLKDAINKIGHGLHKIDDIFSKFTHQEKFKLICDDLGIYKPLIPQSMYIFKSPDVGGTVRPHQDNTFLYTDPLSCLGFWIPLDDAKEENGCLWAIPGSHVNAPLNRFKLNSEKNELYYDPPLDLAYLNEKWPADKYIPLNMKKGSLLLLHGNVVHKSNENKSKNSRHAYTFHIIDSNSKWSKENWLQLDEGQNFQEL